MAQNFIKRKVLFEKHTPKIYTKLLMLDIFRNAKIQSDLTSRTLIVMPGFWGRLCKKQGQILAKIDLEQKRLEISFRFLQKLIQRDEDSKQIDKILWEELWGCIIYVLVSMDLPDSTGFKQEINIRW